MTNLTQIKRTIKQARRQGATYRAIAGNLGITTGAVQRIEQGAYPSEQTARTLGIPIKCQTCHRTLHSTKPRRTSPKIGQPGWEAAYLKQVTR